MPPNIFSLFKPPLLIEYGVVAVKKMFPKLQLNKWGWKEEGACITFTCTTLLKAFKSLPRPVVNVKSLNYLVQNYVCVLGVAECRIGQKYSVTLHVIGTESMILSLDSCLCFLFVIVTRTLLFSVEIYIDIWILVC